uniref:Synaptobrevin, longin-like domain protein n=1 Tax=Tanacetum cinerariifolium TaxID=118510 RepID=A0A699GQJ9_TANCI|nr:hypothetical protein [Tanacetum cinerariifolium]
MADNLPKIVCSIKYALTVNLNIYVSCIKQFWTTVDIKKVNDITRLQALVDKKKVVVTESFIRDVLRLDDAKGVDCLPNEEIFAELSRMGYEKLSTKLTFYKAFFSSQWKFLIHTILQCKEFSGVETPLFEGMLVEQQVDEGDNDEVHGEDKVPVGDVNAAEGAAAGDVSSANVEVPIADEEPFIPSPTPPTLPPQPSQDIPSTSQSLRSNLNIKLLILLPFEITQCNNHLVEENGEVKLKFKNKAICSKSCKKNTDNLNSKITDLSEKLGDRENMLYHYKLGLSQVEARLVEFKNQDIKFCEKIRGLELKVGFKTDTIECLTKELELLKKEKEGLDSKLTGFQSASKDLDNLLESQRTDKNKEGLGYNNTITDYSRPSPAIESTLDDLQNKNPSVTETGASDSTILSKPTTKFLKAVNRPTENKTDKVETVKTQSRVPRVSTVCCCCSRQVNTARAKAVINRRDWVNDVKASACWVWKPAKPNSASIILKRYDYVDVRGKSRVKKLKRRNKVKVLKLRRLQKVRIGQRVETSNDTMMDDVSNQGRMINEMDADADVVIEEDKDVATDIGESAQDQGRKAKSQAEIYKIDLEHAQKILSMQEDESKPNEVQEVVEVVTTAKLITKVVTAASETIIIAKLNRNIDWDEAIDHVNRKAKEDPALKRYQALKRKPQAEAQARKNMIVYLKNVAGFKVDYFKGMYYDDIRPIFEAKFNTNIVPNEKDDFYIEATPLALKVPIVDYEIYNEHNKPYYKIKRADGSHQLYLSFLSMLRNFDREDLEALWRLVKERFATTKPKNISNDFLLTTLGAMFEKLDMHAQIWKNQRSVHGQAKVKSWKLLESYGVQIITFVTTQLILLVERKYPLTKFTLNHMINNVQLEVEEESEVSLELLRFIRQQH